jgi:hypothetical protein
VKNKRRQQRRCCRQHAYNAYALLTSHPSSELEAFAIGVKPIVAGGEFCLQNRKIYIGAPQKGNLLASFPRYEWMINILRRF